MYNKLLLAVHHGQSDSKIKEYIFHETEQESVLPLPFWHWLLL